MFLNPKFFHKSFFQFLEVFLVSSRFERHVSNNDLSGKGHQSTGKGHYRVVHDITTEAKGKLRKKNVEVPLNTIRKRFRESSVSTRVRHENMYCQGSISRAK